MHVSFISPGVILYFMQLAPYLALASLLFALLAVFFSLSLSRRIEKISLGKQGSLESTLLKLAADMQELQQFRRELEVYLKHAESRIQHSIQGVGVVRFNPFSQDGSGGNQSFAIALLDESHSGVVLSALYSRDRVGVYAKPIADSVSTFTLSEEEKQAVVLAQKTRTAKALPRKK